MNQLDLADRQHRTPEMRWAAVCFLAPFGAAIGLTVASVLAVIWLAVDSFGVPAVLAACIGVGAVSGALTAWRSPESFVGKWRL